MAARLTEDQRSIRDTVREFMEKEVKPVMGRYDASGEFPQTLYEKAFEMGLHVLNIPEEFGGAGLDHVTMAVALEEMGRVDPGFAITMLSTAVTLQDVLVGGTPEQQRRAADIIIPGAHGSFSMTEPDAGSDAAALRTTAREEGDFYILNGTKCFATNGGYADLYVIVATVDSTRSRKRLPMPRFADSSVNRSTTTRPCRSSADMATAENIRWRRLCAMPRFSRSSREPTRSSALSSRERCGRCINML